MPTRKATKVCLNKFGLSTYYKIAFERGATANM